MTSIAPGGTGPLTPVTLGQTFSILSARDLMRPATSALPGAVDTST
jgi:hypothetical protein